MDAFVMLLKKTCNLLRLKTVLFLLICASWLLSLGGCATPDVGRVVTAPPAQPMKPPVSIQTPPPVERGYFQSNLKNTFLTPPKKPTKSSPTPGPATTGQ